MTSGGNNFSDFPEIVPTIQSQPKTEKTFLVFSFVSRMAQCCRINSTQINLAACTGETQLIRDENTNSVLYMHSTVVSPWHVDRRIVLSTEFDKVRTLSVINWRALSIELS